MLHENCTGKCRILGELGECADKNQNGIASFKICHWKQRGGNDHSSAFPAVWQTLEWVQFPDSHAGVRTGTAIPWSSTGTGELGMCSGAALRQGLSLLHWNHPSSVAQPGGTGGGDTPEHGAVRGSRELQIHRKHGKQRGACSPGKHTQPGWQTNHPGSWSPSSECVLGNEFTKCHWSLDPNLLYRIYYSKQQPCSLCQPLSALPAEGLQYPQSLQQTPSLFTWSKTKT